MDDVVDVLVSLVATLENGDAAPDGVRSGGEPSSGVSSSSPPLPSTPLLHPKRGEHPPFASLGTPAHALFSLPATPFPAASPALPPTGKPRMYVTAGAPLVGVPLEPFVSVRSADATDAAHSLAFRWYAPVRNACGDIAATESSGDAAALAASRLNNLCFYSRCGTRASARAHAASSLPHARVCVLCERSGGDAVAVWCSDACLAKGWAEHAAAALHSRGGEDITEWTHARVAAVARSVGMSEHGSGGGSLTLKRVPAEVAWTCIGDARVLTPPPTCVCDSLRLVVFVCVPSDTPTAGSDVTAEVAAEYGFTPAPGQKVIGSTCLDTDPVAYASPPLRARAWAVRVPAGSAALPRAWSTAGLTRDYVRIRDGRVALSSRTSAHAVVTTQPVARTLAPLLARDVATPARGRARQDDATCIRVISFNILAEIYALGGTYPSAPTWALAWTYRARMIAHMLTAADADILCLQEVQSEHFESTLAPALAATYTPLYKQKTREALGQEGKIDGCAIFYRHSRLTLVDNFVVEFNHAAEEVTAKRMNKVHTSILGGSMTPDVAAAAVKKLEAAARRLMKDNVAQCAVFRVKGGVGPAPLVCVVNTHLTWDPAYEDVKLWQTHCLLSAVSELRTRHGGSDGEGPMPVVIAGDFNAEPSTSVHHLLRGKLEATALPHDPCDLLPERITAPTGLHLASAYAAVTGAEPPYTNYTRNYRGCLDYVWFTTDSACALTALMVPHPRDLVRNARDDPHTHAHSHPALDGRPRSSADGSAAATVFTPPRVVSSHLDDTGVPLRYRCACAYEVSTDMVDEDDSCVQLPNRFYPSDHVLLAFDIALGVTDPAYVPTPPPSSAAASTAAAARP